MKNKYYICNVKGIVKAICLMKFFHRIRFFKVLLWFVVRQATTFLTYKLLKLVFLNKFAAQTVHGFQIWVQREDSAIRIPFLELIDFLNNQNHIMRNLSHHMICVTPIDHDP